MTHPMERFLLILAVLVAIGAWALPATGVLDISWSFLLYGGVSVLAFFATFLDKRAAVKDSRRFSEFGLHTLELLGGFPGALAAQQLFRHKTVKGSYRVVFWLIVLLHIALWVGYLSIP